VTDPDFSCSWWLWSSSCHQPTRLLAAVACEALDAMCHLLAPTHPVRVTRSVP
jgi:hypothetical protein